MNIISLLQPNILTVSCHRAYLPKLINKCSIYISFSGWPQKSDEPNSDEALKLIKEAASRGNLTVSFKKEDNKVRKKFVNQFVTT